MGRQLLISPPSVESVESLACCALRPTTRRDYASVLHVFERFVRARASARHDLDQAACELLLQKVRLCHSHGSIAGTISALRWAAKNLGVPLSHKHPLHDTLVRATPKADSQLRWVHPSTLHALCAAAQPTAHDQLYTCLAVLSFWHALRVSETCRVDPSHFAWDGAHPTFTIFPSKGRAGPRVPDPVRTPIHPQAVAYGRALCRLLQQYPHLLSPKPTAAALNAWADGPIAQPQSCTSTRGMLERGGCPIAMFLSGSVTNAHTSRSPRLRIPSRASLLRAGFIARRKFGLPAARVARVLTRLFNTIRTACAISRTPPSPLFPRALLTHILSFAWDDADDYTYSPPPTQQSRRALFAQEAPWRPLENVGRCQISVEEIRAAFDPSRSSHNPCPAAEVVGGPWRAPHSLRRHPHSVLLPRPSPSPVTAPMRDFLRDMAALGLTEELDPACNPATCRMSIIPKNEHKSRAICNARYLNQRQTHQPAHFRLPSIHMLKEQLLRAPLYFCTLDVASCYQSMRLPPGPVAPQFIFHVRDPDGTLRAFRLLHIPFGWNASPVICQRRTAAAIGPRVHRIGAWSLVYLDDSLVFSRHPSVAERAGHAAAQGLRDDGLNPHPTKTNLSASTDTVWIGKAIKSCPPFIGPTKQAARNAIAATALSLCAPMSRLARQRMTGTLVWAGSQHRLHLPFLQSVHRFLPPRPARPPPSVVDAALSAAVLAALPWTGQGPVDLPLHGRPHVFFDGVASPTRATAAIFVPPSFAFVSPLPPGTDQQQSEIDAAALAISCAAVLPDKRPVLVGDSSSALFALRRLSCPSRLLRRGDALRSIALTILASGLTYSLAWVPGSGSARNPADPVSRIEAPGPTRLQCGDPALCEARALHSS
eukprot:gene14620-biopygen44127